MRLKGKPILFAAILAFATAPLFAQLATQAPASGATPSPGGTKQRPNRPQTFGTTAISYIEVPANAFLPWDSSKTFTSLDLGRGVRWGTSGSGVDFVAPLHLPAGAKIIYLELDGVDVSATGAVFGSLTVCNYYAAGCASYPSAGSSVGGDCTIPGYICSGFAAASNSGGALISADISADGIVVANFSQEYSLLAETATAIDGSVAIGGMIVGYVLQVSPAPSTATFPDVPMTDFAFQYVEALVASGVTGGCGGGNYCPDSPVTRRQMAIFIAKALGLQWN